MNEQISEVGKRCSDDDWARGERVTSAMKSYNTTLQEICCLWMTVFVVGFHNNRVTKPQ